MDGYEAEIARQSHGNFSRREKQTLRWISEREVGRASYSKERKRRFQLFAWWVGAIVPVALAIWKVAEALLPKLGG